MTALTMTRLWLLAVLMVALPLNLLAQVSVQLEPDSCLCPGQVEYECQANDAKGLVWHSSDNQFGDIEFSKDDKVGNTTMSHLVTAKLTGLVPKSLNSSNFVSTLRVNNFQLNNTKLTCKGLQNSANSQNVNIDICIKGVSGPSNMTVECNLTSTVATIQFHPPVYGAECVAEYIVKAESGEKRVMCTATPPKHLKQTYTCMVPEHVFGYIFTAIAITPDLGGAPYHANNSKICKIIPGSDETSNKNVPLVSFIFSACIGVLGSTIVVLVAAKIAIVSRKKTGVLKKSKEINVIKRKPLQGSNSTELLTVRADPEEFTITSVRPVYEELNYLTSMDTPKQQPPDSADNLYQVLGSNKQGSLRLFSVPIEAAPKEQPVDSADNIYQDLENTKQESSKYYSAAIEVTPKEQPTDKGEENLYHVLDNNQQKSSQFSSAKIEVTPKEQPTDEGENLYQVLDNNQQESSQFSSAKIEITPKEQPTDEGENLYQVLDNNQQESSQFSSAKIEVTPKEQPTDKGENLYQVLDNNQQESSQFSSAKIEVTPKEQPTDEGENLYQVLDNNQQESSQFSSAKIEVTPKEQPTDKGENLYYVLENNQQESSQFSSATNEATQFDVYADISDVTSVQGPSKSPI